MSHKQYWTKIFFSGIFCEGEVDGLFCWGDAYPGMKDHKCPEFFRKFC